MDSRIDAIFPSRETRRELNILAGIRYRRRWEFFIPVEV